MAKRKEQKRGTAAQELVWGGELTIRRIAALKDELVQALDAGAAVEVRLETVSEIDLSFLQLLCAGHRLATRLQQPFSVSADREGRFAEALRQGGFARQLGCAAADGGQGCLWQVASDEP